jgi:hypothetical protein
MLVNLNAHLKHYLCAPMGKDLQEEKKTRVAGLPFYCVWSLMYYPCTYHNRRVVYYLCMRPLSKLVDVIQVFAGRSYGTELLICPPSGARRMPGEIFL